MNEIVNETEESLRAVERDLENIGRSICSAEGGGRSWNAINRAISEVQEAIHQAYLMRNPDNPL